MKNEIILPPSYLVTKRAPGTYVLSNSDNNNGDLYVNRNDDWNALIFAMDPNLEEWDGVIIGVMPTNIFLVGAERGRHHIKINWIVNESGRRLWRKDWDTA